MSKAGVKYCSLHTFVKKENPELFNLLEDLCAIGLFRPKYPTTFINPSSKVVNKLKDLISKGDSETAFEHLQKHFIYGKHTELKGELVTYNSKAMKTDLSKVTKKNTNFNLWKSRGDNVVVYDQTSDDLLEEGAEKERPKSEKKNSTKKGKGDADRMSITHDLLKKASNGENIMHVFAHNINGLLEVLKQHDENQFKKILEKLDPNPVVCWYILVKPSCDCSSVNEDNCYVSDEVFDKWASLGNANINNTKSTLLREVFSSNDFDTSKIAKAKNARKSLNEVGFKQTRESIVNSYDNMTTLLEDELRFRMSDMDNSQLVWNSPEVSELNHLRWDAPENELVLLKNSNSLLNSCLHKIMLDFVSSNAFHYTMFNDEIHKKLENNIVGAGPGAKKIVKVLGKQGRKIIKNLEDSDDENDISRFVSSLNKKQLASLKKVLNSV